MKRNYYRGLYLIAGLYDFILGLSFLFFSRYIFQITKMNFPENPAYITFCALLITLLGILLFMIYSDLEHSRKLVIYAIMIKFAYIGTVLYYYLFIGKDYVDFPFILFAGFDIIFTLLFIESLKYLQG